MPKCRIQSGLVFLETDHQVTTVVVEIAQLVPSQFNNFLMWSLEN